MPELPEVQTTVDGLNMFVKGKKITAVWTDIAVTKPSLAHHETTTKSLSFFEYFKSVAVGQTIKKAERRAKHIMIHLSGGNTIIIHMKMTGHMMYGQYTFDETEKVWKPDAKEKNEALRDPFNRFLHTVFTLSNGKQLVLSDVRKFAKVTVVPTSELSTLFATVGPEPLDESFTLAAFTTRLQKQPNTAIKQVLLDQTIVAGIGNIYSDEMLWSAGVHPLRAVKDVTVSEMKKLFSAMKSVLKKGIDFGGDSTSDYRDITGKRGAFQAQHEAYRRTGKPCRKPRCNGIIVRIPFHGRGAHFCPVHQL